MAGEELHPKYRFLIVGVGNNPKEGIMAESEKQESVPYYSLTIYREYFEHIAGQDIKATLKFESILIETELLTEFLSQAIEKGYTISGVYPTNRIPRETKVEGYNE